MSGPLLLSIESSCDETGIALVEGGRRIVSNVVASQVALHAPSGGIVPEVAARAHLRWIVPTLDEAWDGAGVEWSDIDGVAVTYGPGLAGSLLVGINFAKALAWVHDMPLVAVNHLEGHVYAGWLVDPGEDEAARPEPVFPLVALVVSGGHTFLAEMTDHLTYRLLGTTVDDAAGEAFDKVGRLLGLGYPGGPAIQQAAEGAVRHDVRFPRAWMGDTYDFSFSGLKTAARRVVADARAAEGIAADDADAAAVRRRDRGAGVGIPGLGRRRARERRPAARHARSVPARSCWAGAWRPTAACASGWPARPTSSASRSSSRGRGCAPTTAR